ncbi:hypothetical protein ACFW2Y_07865 [Streptomyces sp. NPDC058877]
MTKRASPTESTQSGSVMGLEALTISTSDHGFRAVAHAPLLMWLADQQGG